MRLQELLRQRGIRELLPRQQAWEPHRTSLPQQAGQPRAWSYSLHFQIQT